jgi:hypothetical protein
MTEERKVVEDLPIENDPETRRRIGANIGKMRQ